MSSRAEEQIAEIEAALTAQEQLRPILGDTIDVAIKVLRQRLADLRAHPTAPPVGFIHRRHSSAASSANPAERRQVTVLFADIVGFTSLSERLDPEEVVEITNKILVELAAVVSRHGGHVDKFIGDSVMALFGAPVAHEDDAARALRAALEMLKQIAPGRHRADSAHGLSLHIGINSGPVIAGHIGSQEDGSYTVMGDTVNIAARLEKAARPGQILLSATTRQLAGQGFSYVKLPDLALKGRGKPQAVYELLPSPLPGSRDPQMGRRLSGIFIARKKELAQLRELDHQTCAGKSRLVLIIGEAGIGKSRLIHEWRRQLAEKRRCTWLCGSCHQTTSAVAYGPFLDLIRHHSGIDPSHQDEATSQQRLALFGSTYFTDHFQARTILTHLLGLPTTPEEERWLHEIPGRRLRELVARLLEEFITALCRSGPVFLMIEDLHWSDPSSWELLESLATRLGNSALTLIAVSRPDPASPTRNEALWQTHMERRLCLKLSPLTARDSRSLIRRILSLQELPDSLSSLVVAKAEGNPFFLEQTLSSLIDSGALARNRKGGWEPTRRIDSTAVPSSLQGLLMSRLDSLPEPARIMAQHAAVIGRSFLYRILGRIASGDSLLDEALATMERMELIIRQEQLSDPEYIFRHALIQEVAYESLLVAKRRELHRQVGEALQENFAERLNEFSPIIGEHFLRGEIWESAGKFLTRAGQAASRIYAHAEARIYFTKALTALERAEDTPEIRRLRVEVTVSLAKVSYFGIPPREVLAYLRQARRLAAQLPSPSGEDTGDPQLLAQLDFHTGQLYYSANRMREALACYREAGDTAPELAGIQTFALGNVLVFQGHMGRARQLLERASTILTKAGDRFLLARTRAMRAYALVMMGDCCQARGEVSAALRVGREISSSHVIAAANLILSASLVYEDPIDGVVPARLALLRAREMSREADDAIFLYLTYGIMAWNLAMGGRYHEAAAEMEHCRELAKAMGEELYMVDMFTARQAEIALGLGQRSAAQNLAEQALEMSGTTGGIWAEACARRTLGRIMAAETPTIREQAEAQLQESLRLYRLGQNFMGVAHTQITIGTIRLGLGDLTGARAQWRLAAEFFTAKGLSKRQQQVQRLLASIGGGSPGEFHNC
ncbi:MAG: AAA family ATPase [Desulfobulbaceae bacterium]|nr:AAA family ATPase [Desulfobulbaceae bacterium]